MGLTKIFIFVFALVFLVRCSAKTEAVQMREREQDERLVAVEYIKFGGGMGYRTHLYLNQDSMRYSYQIASADFLLELNTATDSEDWSSLTETDSPTLQSLATIAKEKNKERLNDLNEMFIIHTTQNRYEITNPDDLSDSLDDFFDEIDDIAWDQHIALLGE